jgi:hypothetical protein
MQLELVPPFVLFGWWFSPWELWRVLLVDIVILPMGFKTSPAPKVLSLTPPLRTLCSVQWMAERHHLYICQALAGCLRRQLYQSPPACLSFALKGTFVMTELVLSWTSKIHNFFSFKTHFHPNIIFVRPQKARETQEIWLLSTFLPLKVPLQCQPVVIVSSM